MARFAVMIVALVACSAFADARHLLQRASGNNNANGAQRVWAVEGSRNMYASLGTSDAIAAAAANGKAYFAAAFGSKASKATTLRSAKNSDFNAANGARHLLQKASGNNNANGAQRVWAVEGSRNMYASLGTSDAIAAAAANGKAYFAAAFGSKASKATTLRSAKNSDFNAANGARHLLTDRTDRADRNSISIQATADLIQSALSSKSTKAATKAGLQYSKLATSNSVRASDFTGARHLLTDRTDRADRNSISIQATADLIQSALSSKSTKAATKAGLQYSKLATSNSVRASDFTGAK
ncbi:hypothetical protein OEZ86_005912 [Tetradesmus obliquus]|uniref:Uncharacterized protein n=1 Tax=Tetradesmus obliquus TaxID=3088 RepID=A0A383VX76_TETOB|nr:hypothetical protein OEZ86_005912 [Tetradesmus obliquus]|eukprot:jgi/Sobl393_1/15508/SZX69364.1